MVEDNFSSDIEDKALNPKFERLGYKDQVLDIINSLKLISDTDKSILKSRFLYEVLNYDARRNHTKKYYNGFRFIVTVGSILLPAILSIGQMDPEKLPKNFDRFSYWASWTISLTVTVCNGFLQLFSLDKNYFEYAITSEQLKTEGWQYFQLSGKYEDYESHGEAYRPFCKSIENIKRKQVEKEFSGKAEVKKKKEYDFEKELEKELKKTEKMKQLSLPKTDSLVPDNLLSKDADASVLSLLSKIAPGRVQEVAQGLSGNLRESVSELVQQGSSVVQEGASATTQATTQAIQEVVNASTIPQEAEPKPPVSKSSSP
jgi:hypothetical protein